LIYILSKNMANILVIVESPAKAKTIGKYLGKGYTVRASMGHVRDLPAKELGIEVDNGTFKPHYITLPGKTKTLSELKKLAQEADRILLATDPDREGEAIAWHILSSAGFPKANVQRVEFHEITAHAVNQAIANPRSLDMNLVNAQQARRLLDRIVGYKISPLLWSKIKGKTGLSAGRVQSVAVRIIVEREREIEEFVPREYWTVTAELAKQPFSKQKQDIFKAVLAHREGKDIGKRWELDNGEQAQTVVSHLEKGSTWQIAKITTKEGMRRPSPPFITSTLQQEASRKLGFPSKKTMQIAQQLYEGIDLGKEGATGLITYMRTDSTNVAIDAQRAARQVIEELFGASYVPAKPPVYTKKVAGAQEAHEAIRPTKPERQPDQVKDFLNYEQFRLYRLIWQRFIASQMSPARIEQTIVEVDATPQDKAIKPYLFKAGGERILFPGFMAVYREGKGDSEGNEENYNDRGSLPPLEQGNLLDLLKLLPEQHFTEPPPRYGEASLVKALEEQGIGRPSTYATILDTIQARGYVSKTKQGKEFKFQPTVLGRTVNDLLVARFPDVVDLKFTAHLESELDEVAEGKRQWTPLVANFYKPLIEKLAIAEKEVIKIEVPTEETGYKSNSKYQRKTAARSYPKKAAATKGQSQSTTTSQTKTTTAVKRAKKPTVTSQSALPPNLATEAPAAQTVATNNNLTCDKCGKPLVKRTSDYGEFWGCSGFPNCRNIKKI
jgi:DNA topoisomerase I